MSIRSEAMATRYRGELSYQLQDILHRNGMRAQVALENDKFVLIVKGHDSPVLEYPITEKQFQALSDGGSNYSNKKAYNTFNSIVGKDFDVPSKFSRAYGTKTELLQWVCMAIVKYIQEQDITPPLCRTPRLFRNASLDARWISFTPCWWYCDGS